MLIWSGSLLVSLENKYKQRLHDTDLSLGKLELDRSCEYFVKIFGLPTYQSRTNGLIKQMRYPGFTVKFSESGLSTMITLGKCNIWDESGEPNVSVDYSSYSTSRGLKIGNSLKQALDLYGHGCIYWTDDLKKQLTIIIGDNDKVEGMIIENR